MPENHLTSVQDSALSYADLQMLSEDYNLLRIIIPMVPSLGWIMKVSWIYSPPSTTRQ